MRVLFQHRALLRDLVLREVASRYAGSGLGWFWTLLQPLLMIGLFHLVFSRWMSVRLGAGSGPGDYVVYLCAAILPWFALQDAAHRACNLFLDNAALVKKVALPPLLLVGQLVGAMVVTLGLSYTLFVTILVLAGRPPGASLWLLLPAMAVLTLLVSGVVLALSVLNVFFRDLGHLVPVATTVWFWLTPIVYAPQILPDTVLPLLRANPLVPVIEMFRRAVGAGPAFPGASGGWTAAATAAVLSLGSYWLFRSLVRDVADEI